MGLLLKQLEAFIGAPPTGKPGLLHQVDDDYFEKMDALAFTVRNDDLRSPSELAEADIILIGASRTSKTPLSIYLALEGWRVANLHIDPGEPIAPELESADPKRVVGLVSSPERLAEVRKARLSRMASADSTYADMERVLEELEYCRSIVAQHPGWILIDVTGKSVEETAAEILDSCFGRERRI
jgi:regulator of PEP synthase PpsR (kinase-PPPase family)